MRGIDDEARIKRRNHMGLHFMDSIFDAYDRESVEEVKKKRLWMTTTALRRY